MLDEGAAANDIERLHAATNGQYRYIVGDGRLHQREFERVLPGIDTFGLLVSQCAVSRGVDVSPAHHDQRIGSGKDEARPGEHQILVVVGERGNHHRLPTGVLDRLRVTRASCYDFCSEAGGRVSASTRQRDEWT